jgi:hypothetical protein
MMGLNMHDGIDRRRFLGAGGLTLAAGVVATLPNVAFANAAMGRNLASPMVVTLHMGVPELDTSGRQVPYCPGPCPGRNLRDHGTWWLG